MAKKTQYNSNNISRDQIVEICKTSPIASREEAKLINSHWSNVNSTKKSRRPRSKRGAPEDLGEVSSYDNTNPTLQPVILQPVSI